MSLDKAIKHGKEHRQEYRGSRRFDASCRNHGGCPWCSASRLRRKIEEKLEIVGRGSYEKQIKIDFVRVRRRASVAIHNYSVGAINAIIAQQHNILARFG